jgi:hypothetical protein
MERILHFMWSIFIFAALGPLVGWATLVVIMYAMSLDFWSFGGLPKAFVSGAAFSYIFGLVPALLAGVIVSFGQVLLRSFGFFHALVVGIAVGSLVVWKPSLLDLFSGFSPGGRWQPLNHIPFTQDPTNSSEFARAAATLVSICVIPTLVCWFISPDGKSKLRPIELP